MAAPLCSPRRRRWAYTPAVAALCLLTFAWPARAEGRIAVVDMQYALLQTEEGRKVRDVLKKLFDRRQQEINSAQEELAQMEQDIKKQEWLLSREALQKRTEDWQRRMIAVQQKYIEYQKELQEKQANLAAPIIKKLANVVGRLANKHGFEVVVDRQAIAYVRTDLDLTDQVIQMYNSGDVGDSAPTDKSAPADRKDGPKTDIPKLELPKP
jgi:outer membrane protein